MPIAPSVEKLHAIKGMIVILHLGSDRWIGAVNLFNVRCVSKSLITSIFNINDHSS